MDHPQRAAHAASRRWSSRSDRFMAAAECLPPEPAFDLPRSELLARAVECRLKAYLYAARGGSPPGDDLTHLHHLAAACGLRWQREQDQVLAALVSARMPADPAPAPPPPAVVRALCLAVQGQIDSAA